MGSYIPEDHVSILAKFMTYVKQYARNARDSTHRVSKLVPQVLCYYLSDRVSIEHCLVYTDALLLGRFQSVFIYNYVKQYYRVFSVLAKHVVFNMIITNNVT